MDRTQFHFPLSDIQLSHVEQFSARGVPLCKNTSRAQCEQSRPYRRSIAIVRDQCHANNVSFVDVLEARVTSCHNPCRSQGPYLDASLHAIDFDQVSTS